MAATPPQPEPTHEQLRAQALDARLASLEIRRESRELIARCVERRLERQDSEAAGDGWNRGKPA